MGTHPLPDVVVVAFSEQVAIHFAHPFTTEGPGIVLFMHDPTALNPDLVVAAWISVELCLEHPGVVRGVHGDLLATLQEGDRLGLRHPHPHGPTLIRGLGTKHRERVVMATIRQPFAVLHHPVEDCGDTHGRPKNWARC